MHPLLITIITSQRSAELRAEAERVRRGRRGLRRRRAPAEPSGRARERVRVAPA